MLLLNLLFQLSYFKWSRVPPVSDYSFFCGFLFLYYECTIFSSLSDYINNGFFGSLLCCLYFMLPLCLSLFLLVFVFPVIDFLQISPDPWLSLYWREIIKSWLQCVCVYAHACACMCVCAVVVVALDWWTIHKVIWDRLGLFFEATPNASSHESFFLCYLISPENKS